MRADLPKLKWSTEIAERLDLKPSKDNDGAPGAVYPKSGGEAFDLDAACAQIRKQRNFIPVTETMSDAAVRFWFWAGTDTSVAIDDVIDAASKIDLKKKPSLKEVETRFAALVAANRWDIPQPQSLIPLMPRLVSWDDTIRLLLDHPRPYTVYAMLWALPTPEECGASKEVAERGRARLMEFIDSRDNAGTNEVGAALRFVDYPKGAQRFFDECKKGYAKRYAGNLGAPLLVQLATAKDAYKAAKTYKITLTPSRIIQLIERFGFEDADLLVDACAKSQEELKRVMHLHTPTAVAGWLRCLKKAALVDFAEHWLLNEGANAIEGLIKTAARRGQMRDHALDYLNRIAAAGHGELIEKLASDEPKKLRDLIEAHVLAESEEGTPELPEDEWPKWMSELMKGPKAAPELAALMPSQLPTVRTADGAYRIPTPVLEALLAKVALSQSTPAALTHAKKDFHADDVGPFAWLFFERWFAGKRKADTKGGWVLTMVEVLGGEPEAAALGATLISSKWGRSLRPKAMAALRRMESREALTALARIKNHYASAGTLLDEVATKWGCDREEFLDRIVPTCGLDDLHCLELDFGERKPIAAVLPPSRIVIVDRDAGDVFQKIPPRRKGDDNDLYAIAREKYKLLRKSLGQVAEEQIPRLEQAMTHDRRFTHDHWRTHLSLHAVLGPIVCTLVWKTKRDGVHSHRSEWVLFMPTHPDDTCIDTAYDEVQLGDEIALAHPADMSDAQRSAWAEVIADSEIVQPFDQLARLAFKPGSPEVDAEIARLKSVKRTGYDMNQWMYQHGFRVGPQKDQKHDTYLSTTLDGKWTTVVHVEPSVPAWNWPPSGEHVITKVSFRKDKEEVDADASTIPPVIYSEQLRKLFMQ